jgi:trimeric autotransporter adhesin
MIVMMLSALRALLAAKFRFISTAGVAFFLCVTCSCSGFFISPSLSSIFVTPPSASVAVNSTVQLTATGTYSDGSQRPLQGESVGWSSSDDTIASITSPGGLVTGVASGTATITVSAQGVSGTATISVTPANVTNLIITTTQGSTMPTNSATISTVPNTLQFYAYANMSASQDVTTAVTWTSSTSSVGTIGSGGSSAGLLSVTTAGTTTITATITNSTTNQVITSNSCVVTVQ